MAILKIARMGHPVLRRRAEAVADPASPEIAGLIRDMLETMADAEGAGLAAPQVHVPLRVVIFHAPADRDADEEAAESIPLTVMINPGFEPVGEARSDDWEACLSVPGLTGLVPRWETVRYWGVTPDGGTIERVAEGFHARVVQHEFDHLDGILYPARMTDMSSLMFSEEMRHYAESDDEDDEDELEAEAV